jgi:hypothetical protein
MHNGEWKIESGELEVAVQVDNSKNKIVDCQLLKWRVENLS